MRCIEKVVEPPLQQGVKVLKVYTSGQVLTSAQSVWRALVKKDVILHLRGMS